MDQPRIAQQRRQPRFQRAHLREGMRSERIVAQEQQIASGSTILRDDEAKAHAQRLLADPDHLRHARLRRKQRLEAFQLRTPGAQSMTAHDDDRRRDHTSRKPMSGLGGSKVRFRSGRKPVDHGVADRDMPQTARAREHDCRSQQERDDRVTRRHTRRRVARRPLRDPLQTRFAEIARRFRFTRPRRLVGPEQPLSSHRERRGDEHERGQHRDEHRDRETWSEVA